MMNSAKLFVCLILFEVILASTQAGKFSFRITGGSRPTEHTLVKHVVSIIHKGYDKFGTTHKCGGAIINSKLILTAAHCLWNSNLNKKIKKKHLQIVAGTPNRLKQTEHTQIMDVKHVLVHPDYNDESLINDIGSLVLASEITLDGVYAQSIPLIDGPPKKNQSCTTVGWGDLFKDGPHPAEALYANLNILPRKLCEILFQYFTKGQICVGEVSDYEKNTCQGDSGNPLICDGKVAGLVSYGSQCEKTPTVYTDVWFYRNKFLKKWIFGCQGKITMKIMNILLLKFLVWIVI